MTFEEWLEAKPQPRDIEYQTRVGEAIRQGYVNEYRAVGEMTPEAGGQSAGGRTSQPGEPIEIGNIDFSDQRAIAKTLRDAEWASMNLPYEVNTTVTADGKVWRVEGDAGTVNPSSIPSDLKGSHSYHNHPAGVTHYSFSGEDAGFFIESGTASSKASDELFEYEMRRTAETLDKSWDEVYHRFSEIEITDVFELQFKQAIDPDIDTYHEVMQRLSEELRFEYERKRKDS